MMPHFSTSDVKHACFTENRINMRVNGKNANTRSHGRSSTPTTDQGPTTGPPPSFRQAHEL